MMMMMMIIVNRTDGNYRKKVTLAYKLYIHTTCFCLWLHASIMSTILLVKQCRIGKKANIQVIPRHLRVYGLRTSYGMNNQHFYIFSSCREHYIIPYAFYKDKEGQP